ncbi:MAG: FAD-dependent oxidoreductase [Candidatus Adiutrix sp.]|jgi:electron transfer flavoprotein-quinone oxidoreductase|nr:FAD-dependent oxidoreductase [Candidatus Adiutrix sp.]
MSEDKFDAIIVGAGIAGATAALLLAREGLSVVVVERGNYAGAKNMTGGRLYAHSLEAVIPGFAEAAPVERRVTQERISLMTETGCFTASFLNGRPGAPDRDSYVVLRGAFDRWLMEQAEAAGAMLVSGVLVDDLLTRDGRVCGVIAGEDKMPAEVVILADGANSQLLERAGLRAEPVGPRQMAVGVKEVIEFDDKVVEDRFNLLPGEGLAWLFAGLPSGGKVGGGFLYTNKASVSVGLVATTAEFMKSERTIHELLERFKAHPAIEPLLKGGKLAEYSGHMVAEGGYDMIPRLYNDGVVVIGEAAHLVINLGYTVRGMDLAAGSAQAAAKAVIAAKQAGDFSARSLAAYKTFLDDSFVIKDMKHYRKFPHFMENSRLFNEYPEMLEKICAGIFTVDGRAPASMLSKLMEPMKEVGLLNLMKDGLKGARSL